MQDRFFARCDTSLKFITLRMEPMPALLSFLILNIMFTTARSQNIGECNECLNIYMMQYLIYCMSI